MKTQVYIWAVLITIAFAATQPKNNKFTQIDKICELSLNKAEWNQQSQKNMAIEHIIVIKDRYRKLILKKLIQHFQNSGDQKEQTQFQQYIAQVTPQLQAYTYGFKMCFFGIGLVFVYQIAMFFIKLFGIKIRKTSSKRFQNLIRSLKIIFFVCIIVSIYFGITGYGEGEKASRGLATLICKIYQGPKGIIKGGIGPQYDGYKAFISQMDKYLQIFFKNYASIKYLISNQHVIRQMIDFGQKIVSLKQLSNIQVEQQINFQRQMNKTIDLLQKIHSKLLKIKIQVKTVNSKLQLSKQLATKMQFVLKIIQNYSQQHISLVTFAKFAGNIIKCWFGFICIILFGIIWQIFVRKNTKSISKAIVKYLLVLILTVSLLIAYFNSYLIPSLFWVNQVQAYVSQNQGNFKNQLSGLHPNLLDIFAKIIPKTEANIAEMYTANLMQSISQYGSIVEAYSQTELNYFDELFQKGINISKQANIDTKRILYLQKKNLMHNILANFQMSKEGVKEILQTVRENGKLAVIRPAAFGVYVREVYRVIRIPLFNRIYEARWTCKSIGILLLVGLICLIFVNEAEKTIGPQYKQITQNQQKVQSELQLFTSDNVH